MAIPGSRSYAYLREVSEAKKNISRKESLLFMGKFGPKQDSDIMGMKD
jgi:hypothetical protein